jgi:hypothetical protein
MEYHHGASSGRDQGGGVPKSSEKSTSRGALNGVGGAEPGESPRVVAPSSRVNIAFPFSQIKLEEPTKELAELAALVFDLVGAMADWVPEDGLDELRTRAQVLRDALR